MLSATDIMTTKIRTVYADAPLDEAADILLTYDLSGVPVLARTGELVGILTDADLLRRVELGTDERAGWLSGFFRPGATAGDYARSHGRTVDEIMTRDVIVVGDTAPLSEIVRLMQSHGVKRLPVIRDSKLVGIVSRMDLLKALRALLAEHGSHNIPDAEVEKNFFSELGKQQWAPRIGVGAQAKDGIIRLEGVISDERERVALKVLAENTPGCRGVSDHLVCVEPLSGALVDNPSP